MLRYICGNLRNIRRAPCTKIVIPTLGPEVHKHETYFGPLEAPRKQSLSPNRTSKLRDRLLDVYNRPVHATRMFVRACSYETICAYAYICAHMCGCVCVYTCMST